MRTPKVVATMRDHHVTRALLRVMAELKARNVTLISAGLSFYALLALVPGMVALVSLYGLVSDPADVEEQVTRMASALPDEAQALVVSQMEAVTSTSGAGLGAGLAVGLALALWSSSVGMQQLIRAVNEMYGYPETRNLLHLRSLALLFTVGAVVLLTISLLLIAALPAALASTGLGADARLVLSLLRWPVLAFGVIAGLTVLYRFAPVRRPDRWTVIRPGQIVATVLWIVGSAAFSYFAANFGSYNETYGSLGAVVLLMTWFLLTAYCILLGAGLNVALERTA